MLMELFLNFIVEIVFRRVIIGVFGYYTLWFIYKLFNYKKGLNWLQNPGHGGDELTLGCLISLVGLVSFAAFFSLIFYLCFAL